jgi:ubiquinone/menaquinone biosynthesis C-methylase UbiE
MWAMGSYSEIAPELLPASAHLVRAASVHLGDSVLDVACVIGITSITARKQSAKVTRLDLTSELLSQAKQEASIASVGNIKWKEGDVEELPFYDNSFDVVLSSFGHMFAPRPDICTSELVRVTKSAGRI